MAVDRRMRWGMVVAWAVAVAAIVIVALLRIPAPDGGPAVVVAGRDESRRTVTLAQLKRLPALERSGRYENQFGNWRDEGIYTGVLLMDLLGADVEYARLRLVASDGYRVEVERNRVEDLEYPMALAYAFDGVEIPDWEDGPRIVVLPEDGDVSNEEYGTTSAGSFWIKNVTEIHLLP